VAYVLLATVVVAAALQASVVTKHGQPEQQWMGICALYHDFCRQAGAGVARPGSPPPCLLSSLPATSSGYTAARSNIV
jgi:hypothetical protein